MKFNLTDVQALIRARRSVRPERLSLEKVHRDQIEALIEAANWAPTHGQTEPWRFKVFTGSALESLQQIGRGLSKDSTELAYLQSKYDRIRTGTNASAGILVYMKRQVSGKIPEVEILARVCRTNMSLFGNHLWNVFVWSSGSAVYEEQFAEEIGILKPDRILGVLYPGYPEGNGLEGKRQFWMTKGWIGSQNKSGDFSVLP